MKIEIYPEKDGDYINFNAFNEEDGILGVMRVHETVEEIEIINIMVFPEYSYRTVVNELFDFLFSMYEESECKKVVNITYELDEESIILHYYLIERSDFMLVSNGGIYKTTVKDAACIINNPEMKKLNEAMRHDVKPFKVLLSKQKKNIESRLARFSLMEKADIENIEKEYDLDLSCANFDKETGEVNASLLASYDGKDTLFIDAAFLVNEKKIQFMELIVYFMAEALKKYPDAKLELTAVNDASEALCDNFASRIKNVIKSDCYTGIWAGIQADYSENDYT